MKEAFDRNIGTCAPKVEKLRTKNFIGRRSLGLMPVTIEIPTAFRRFTDGAPRVDCSASTVAEALDTLTKRFPGLSRHVRDDSGQIRQFLNIYLNEELADLPAVVAEDRKSTRL